MNLVKNCLFQNLTLSFPPKGDYGYEIDLSSNLCICIMTQARTSCSDQDFAQNVLETT